MNDKYKTFYLYDAVTFRYLGPYVAQASPREEGEYIFPLPAADDAPPPYDEATETCERQVDSATWLIQPIPAEAPEGDPPPETPPTLDQVKATQIANLSSACQVAIYMGFTSSALGKPYRYPMQDKDQMNMAFAVGTALASASESDWRTGIWCEAVDGGWGLLDHTSAQVLQINVDWQSARLGCMKRNATLSAMVESIVVGPDTDEAAAITAVEAISWATEIPPPEPAPTEPTAGDAQSASTDPQEPVSSDASADPLPTT